MLSVATSVLLTRALVELNAADAGGAVQPELSALALDTFNQILDDWNAERGKIHADQFLGFTITPNLNPHTIGPAGSTWVTTQAPVSIEGIQVAVSAVAPITYRYLVKRDAKWWQERPTPALTASFPTDFYYDPTWTPAAPRGSIYFWPVPTTAWAVQIWCRVVLAQVLVNTTFSLPPGYNRALMLTLAKALSGPLRKVWQPVQEEQLIKAVRQIQSNNTVVPRIATRQSGVPHGDGPGRPNFFWPDGSLTSR